MFTILYFIFCTLFFEIVQKPFFGCYNRSVSKERITVADMVAVYRHGFVSDLIIASYLTAFPLIVSAIHTMLPCFNLTIPLTVYNVIIALAIGLICVSDTLLYKFWNYKLDASAFVYLRSLKGAFASVSTGYLIAAFSVVFLVTAIFMAGAELVTLRCARLLPDGEWLAWWKCLLVFFVMVVMTGGLFAIIRGLKIRPNNPSVVYYSKNPFFNHWALNPAYNLIYSLGTKDEFKGKFRFFDDDECTRIVTPLFPTSGTPQRKLLNTDRPNILLIVWESLGAEFVPSLGGREGVAVNVDRIAADGGVLFTRCTAGSFRTDRGLVCLLGGYLGQPTTSVIRYTRKLPNLPALPRRLKEEGYVTTAVHGGDLTIMHKSDYYLASGHDRLVSQKDFPSSAPTCKWGIHDGYMFDFIYDDIMDKTRKGERWFTTFQTLSSHEPFTVPYKRLDNEVDNSFAYTDHCFGEFIDKLKKSPAWKDTLVICVADHGYNVSHHPVSRQKYAHIPLLLTGGAVASGARIDTIMSQTDLAATLLSQMGLPHDEFIFSRDILADTYLKPFSFHTYTNGFMLTDERGWTIVDNVSDEAIENPDPERERNGRAILQKLYEDLAER
ncbi:MAG: sulfatase-like hydrolase/transferase [Bacteroides sp.]|nr:sulfatase-like hydrolase/transferase [Bacteroides sp.]